MLVNSEDLFEHLGSIGKDKLIVQAWCVTCIKQFLDSMYKETWQEAIWNRKYLRFRALIDQAKIEGNKDQSE